MSFTGDMQSLSISALKYNSTNSNGMTLIDISATNLASANLENWSINAS